jgi:hypothetical protein
LINATKTPLHQELPDLEMKKFNFDLNRKLYEYPYISSTNARLDFANVTSVVQEYVAKTLRTSLSTDFLVTSEMSNTFPASKKWVSFKYPKVPDQWIEVSRDEVDQYWAMKHWQAIPDVVSTPAAKRDARMFLFVVAMRLVEEGLVDDYFKAKLTGIFTGAIPQMQSIPLNVRSCFIFNNSYENLT